MPDVPGQFLKWNYRRKEIIKSLLASNADIICLQEVDKRYGAPQTSKHYLTFGQSNDIQKGLPQYSSAYLSRNKDGLMILWKKSRLTMIERYEVQYDALINDIHPEEANTQRNAIILEFQFIETGTNILVATTHLEWKPS